ncbi:SAF domain-containing protein [Oscillochloris trichoides DG-6]|uniref:SAF domain-containing protein n=1 Tax=Oscillochloris trichoides DG-6 TaxID=765420 RepID=E1IHG3_9CHLR|nr:Flp pilus assembly protein CpaB [Oscillochloris trichoides]EFO79369.1 SAF domain-containing protein [Oscillochloris trichoides DG-6]
MRRGGVLIILLVLILVVGGVLAFFFLQDPSNPLIGGSPATDVTSEPTAIPLVDVVHARFDIAANTVIKDTDVELVKIKQTEFNPDTQSSNLMDVVGKLTTSKIVAEQPINTKNLIEPGLSQQIPTAEADRSTNKAYPLIVNNLSGVSDQIKPGDFVDVVVTFQIPRRQSYPTGLTYEEVGGQMIPMIERELKDELFYTTKTIVQRAQVLKILRPQVALPEETPVAGSDAPVNSSSLPEVDASGQPIAPGTEADTTGSISQGAWTLVLSVNDQEVELIEFALSTNSRIVLVLRGAGDTEFEETIGVTYDLLTSEFGVPVPQQIPANVLDTDDVFTADPTRTPAPTRVP